MSKELLRAQEKLAKKVAGPTPVEKHIILTRLADLYANMPDLQSAITPGSHEREWFSTAAALLHAYDRTRFGILFNSKLGNLNYRGVPEELVGMVGDAVEAIKLDLELDGRSEIGTVYDEGEVYRFFADMKDIIAGATKQIFLIEPYLNGDAFDKYFGKSDHVELRLLVGKMASEVKQYANLHMKQFNTKVEVRKSKKIHDRLIIADRAEAWVIGGSLNMKGDKPTYLLPLTPGIAEAARDMYSDIWDRANPVS